MDSLAVIRSEPTTFASAIGRAALADGTSHADREMFVRLDEDCVETPASGTGARRASYCTLRADRFEEFTVSSAGSVDAMFDVGAVLGWLDWVEGDRLTVRFEGQAGVTSRLVLECGDDRVAVACVDDPAVLSTVETFLPDRFAGETFLSDDGTPMPTTVETTVAELERLVRAVDLAEASEGYPLTIRDGRLTADFDGEAARVTAPLGATVDGPAVTNRYGDGFAEVVDGIEGEVTLQTGPGEAVAFVQSGTAYTLRFVVAHG
jgi:hypothetical protein